MYIRDYSYSTFVMHFCCISCVYSAMCTVYPFSRSICLSYFYFFSLNKELKVK